MWTNEEIVTLVALISMLQSFGAVSLLSAVHGLIAPVTISEAKTDIWEFK